MNNDSNWYNSKEYLDVLEDFLVGAKNTSYYEGIRNAHIDIDRFFGWIEYIKEFKEIENLSVLDMGCGTGGMLIALSTFGARATGIEVDRGLFKLGKIRLKGNPNIEMVLTDGKKIPFPDNHFDVITCIHVVEHVEQTIEEFLDELYRVLKPGGIALIECPNRCYPVEPHNNIYAITYLPKNIADSLCLYLSNREFLDKDLRLRLKNVASFRYFLSYFSLEKKIRNLGQVDIIKTTPTERFSGPTTRKKIPYGMLKFLTMIFSKDVSIIFRKT